MKIIYDWDERTQTHICQACGYKHVADVRGMYPKTIEGDDKFIEMEGVELHSTDRSYYYPSHNIHTIYACPKCGVLQIEV